MKYGAKFNHFKLILITWWFTTGTFKIVVKHKAYDFFLEAIDIILKNMQKVDSPALI